MSDNRQRPRIHRTDDKHDKALRDYATEHGIEPWQALEVAIARLPWFDGRMSALRSDLESAREATRRADHAAAAAQEAYALASTERDDLRNQALRLTRELAEVRAAPQPCACALPAELDQRVRDRIAARPGRDLAFVLKNGCDRLEASDGYQDRQKAAKRAARSS